MGEVCIVVNPAAGRGRAPARAAVLSASLHDAGIRHVTVRPTSALAATKVAGDAVARGAGAVVACGGDGTVHRVLQALVGTSVPLGILPCGTGDDIADGLGFDVGSLADRICATVRTGTSQLVDVGYARAGEEHGRFFLGVLSTGFDSAVNERGNRLPRLGGQRYRIAMLGELASFRPVSYRLAIDDEVVSGPAMMVAIGNCARYGGGMRICPTADPTDGLLDVTWVSSVSRRTLVRLFPSVYSGRHVHQAAVRTFRGRRLLVGAAGQVAYADGERVGPLPVSVDVRPGALRVLAG